MNRFKLMILAGLITGLLSCGGSDDGDGSEDRSERTPSVGTKTVMVGDAEYTVPEYAFINETFEYTQRLNGEESPRELTFYHFSNRAPDECCDLRPFESGQFHSIQIPTYSQVLDLGPAITLPDGQEHEIKLAISTDFLDSVADSIGEITWSIPNQALNTFVSDDKKSVTFTAPPLLNIEKWHFTAQVKTDQGRVFEANKVVFIVPESDWVNVTHVYEGPLSRVAFREDNTFYFGDDYGRSFSRPINKPVKHIASTGVVYLVSDDNELIVYNQNGELFEDQPNLDFGNIIELVTVFSARNTTLIINDEGSVFSSYFDYELILDDAKGVAPALYSSNTTYLDTSGDIRNPEDRILDSGVEQLSGIAYRTSEGEIGVIRPEFSHKLQMFSNFNDYIYVTSEHPSEYDSSLAKSGSVYALRQNNQLVSNSRLPPELGEVQSITSGDVTSALTPEGRVHRWSWGRVQSSDDILSGRLPNPMNLTEEAFEAYRAGVME